MRWLVRLLVAGFAALLLGFAAFVSNLPSVSVQPERVAAADGIVVPTGGPERIATGLALLEASGARLLITGVNPDVSLDAVLAEAGRSRPDCCLDLDRGAANTVGNAEATRIWAERHGFRRIHLVTSWYHLPRSHLLFERALPDISIIPHPVFPGQQPGYRWWLKSDGWRLVAVEYGKFVWALFSPWDTL